jgi:hypothetical protein
MKKTIILSALAFTMTIIACNNPSTKNESSGNVNSFDTTKLAQGVVFYQCPMHPEQLSDKPGSCSKCGMDLEKKEKSGASEMHEHSDSTHHEHTH